MSTKEKLLKEFLQCPSDFTYNELVSLLKALGFVKKKTGKTSGSREAFCNNDYIIKIHKPHDGIIGRKTLSSIRELLEKGGYL